MKNPRRSSPGGLQLNLVIPRSWNDVAVHAHPERDVVLVADREQPGRYRRGRCRVPHNRSIRCRLELLVEHVEADIEPGRDVPLGTGTNRPDVEVVVAAGPYGKPEPGGARSVEADPAARSRSPDLCAADRKVGHIVVPDREVRAVERGPQVRPPEVVVSCVHAPGRGQLDVTRYSAVDTVGVDAVSELSAVEPGYHVGRVRRCERGITVGTLGVVDLELEVASAEGIELGAEARRPADLIGRMTANLRSNGRTTRHRDAADTVW